MLTIKQLLGSTQRRLSTSRRDLLAAFKRVIDRSGSRCVTDLHVRRLLKYVRANDRFYTGIPRSLARLARKLVLSVSTCRRVIARAVDEFGLLIVIPQRHNRGGQTVNRYTINWDQVDALVHDSSNDLSLPRTSARAARTHSPVVLRSTYSRKAYSPQPGPRLATLSEPSSKSKKPSIVLPKDTPAELLSHFDTLLTKLQAAIDRAKQLGVTKIENRLTTLWQKLSAVHYRASHAALCRTNLPPLNPIPEPSWDIQPFDLTSIDFGKLAAERFAACKPLQISPIDLSDHAPQDANSRLNCPSGSDPNSRNAYSLQPAPGPALCDHPPLDQSHNSPVRLGPDHPPMNRQSCANPSRCQSCYDPEVLSLLVALDDLITSFTAALDCAVQHHIIWLQDRFTSLRASIKSICTHLNQCLSCYDPENTDSPVPLALPVGS